MASKRTVAGKPIPEELAHQVPYNLTDQGIADANAAPQKVARVSRVVRDAAFERKLERMQREVEIGADPFAEVIEDLRTETDTHIADTDHQFRFLSDRVVKRRGMRNWNVVKDDKGDPIKVADLTLAAMPKEIAELRTEKYRQAGVERFENARATLVASQERLIAESGASGLSPLRNSDNLTDYDNPDRTATVGVTRQRGGG